MYKRNISFFLMLSVVLVLISDSICFTSEITMVSPGLTEENPAKMAITLTVHIAPANAIAAGAKWRWKGENEIWSDWYDSGFTETNGLEGNSNNVIQFSDVAGWIKPDDVALFVTDGPFNVARQYYRPTGRLKVNITPEEVVTAGAKWRWKDSDDVWSNWRASGYTDTTVILNSYVTVEFKDLVGWNKPDDFTTTISNDLPAYTRSYTSGKTRLKVDIGPSAKTGDATWSLYYAINGNRAYVHKGKKSGEQVELTPGLTYFVEFSYVTDLAKPMDIKVTGAAGDQTVSAKYKDLIVGKIHLYGKKLSASDTEFHAMGQSTWAFVFDWGGESVRHFKFKGNLSGKLAPAMINGNGSLMINTDVGTMDYIFSVMSNKSIFKGKMSFDAESLETVATENCEPLWSYIGVEYTNTSFKLFRNPFAIEQTGFGELRITLFDDPTRIDLKKLRTTEGDDMPQVKGKAVWQGATAYEFIEITKTKVDIDTETKTFSAKGFEVIVAAIMPSFKGEFVLEDGVVKKLSAELSGLGIGVGDEVPIEIDRAAIDFENPDSQKPKISFEGEASVSIPKVDVEVGQVILEGELDMEGKLRAEGDYTILGYTLGHSESELLFKGATQYITSSIDVSTMVGPGILPILIEGAGEVFLQWKPSKFFSGWLMVGLWFPVPDWLDWLIKEDPYYISSTYAGIDEDGFHFRFKILKLTFSFDVKPKWLNSSAPMQISLKNDETGVISKVSAAKAKPTFRVGGNVPTELIAFQGKNSEPEVVLTRPDGMVLDSTMDPSDMPDNVTCVVDDDNRTVGFLIKRPMAGEWKIDIKNLDVCGNVNTHQLHGNNEPEVVPKEIKEATKGEYSLSYQAFDKDDQADLEFYFSPDNTGYSGVLIGCAKEADGLASFEWKPEAGLSGSGYVFVTVNDGYNPPKRAYFPQRVYLDVTPPATPRFIGATVSKDKMLLKFGKLKSDEIKRYRVYYSDNLKEKYPTEYFTVKAAKRVKMNSAPIKPGRRYQLYVTAINADGLESARGRKKKLNFKLSDGNNDPFIYSTPVVTATVGQEYVYDLKCKDYDGNSISWKLANGPEGMSLGENSILRWTPTADDRGIKTIRVVASDGNGGTDVQKFKLSVTSSEAAPALVTMQQVAHGLVVVTIADPDLSGDASSLDIQKIRVTRKLTGETITATLKETSADSRVFKGFIRYDNSISVAKGSGADALASAFDVFWKDSETGEEKSCLVKELD